MGSDEPKVGIFVRQSTGLVRAVGGWGSFFATFALVTGGVPIFLVSLLFLSPGANYTLALIIMFLPSMALGSVYTLFGISMPRSGGDYVFVSRGLNSFLGFINSFGLFFAYVFSVGIYSLYGAQYLASTMATYGFITNNSGLISLATTMISQNYLVVTGLAIIIIFLLLLTFTNTRTAFKLILITGILEIVATVIFFAINATITQSQFITAFDKYAGSGAYYNVIQSAKSNGLLYAPGARTTLLALPIAWYAFTWYTLPANWSGEMRQVKRSLPLAILGALLVILIFYLVFYNVSFHSFGQQFLTAWSFNYLYGYSLPFSFVGTYTPFFVSLVYTNPLIPVLAILVFWLPDIFFFIPTMIGGTRYLFAWSFDRMAPEIFSRVSMKTKVPTISTIAIGVLAIIGLLAYAYIPAVAIVDIIPIFDFAFIIPAITAILIPFVKKDMYENSFVVKRKIIGLPLISWLGIIALAGIIYGIIGLWNSYLMPINYTTGVAIFGVYITAAVIYAGMYFVNRRKGVDPRLAFKEIPPE
jgi:amino acid transporter